MMHTVVLWAGALGAWLLVAGPMYHGANELREQQMDREGITQRWGTVEHAPSPSPWWWLLPPVMLLKRHRINEAFKRDAMGRLTKQQRQQFAAFTSKARGWLTVAAGASLIGFKETWELGEHYELPDPAIIGLAVLALGVCLLITSLAVRRDERVWEGWDASEPAPGE